METLNTSTWKLAVVEAAAFDYVNPMSHALTPYSFSICENDIFHILFGYHPLSRWLHFAFRLHVACCMRYQSL